MAKNFTTIFPITVNSHLIKDLGQIPHFLNKFHGYKTQIVSYKNSSDYFHTRGEVSGVEMNFIQNIGKKHFWEKGVIKYLNENAKDIDVLNLYHFKKDTFVYGNLYKKLNPKGKLYLKMDAYNDHFKKGRIKHSAKFLKQFYFKKLEKDFLNNVDLVSIENTEGLALVGNNYPELKNKLSYLPNGVNDVFLKEHFPQLKTFKEKENIILSVGRIGLEVKNNEMLLNVIPKLDLKDWKVFFVGPIHEPFKIKIEQFYNDNPSLADKVKFVGEVSDREALYEYYNRSKIFCLTSPFESFGIAFVEAMYFGNYIVGTTGMSAFKDLSNNFKYGKWTDVNANDNYAKEIQTLIDNNSVLEEKCEEIKTFTNDNFSWSKIVTKLNQLLSD
jgi:glycosyltransferase involved in cell wall biosynthesis